MGRVSERPSAAGLLADLEEFGDLRRGEVARWRARFGLVARQGAHRFLRPHFGQTAWPSTGTATCIPHRHLSQRTGTSVAPAAGLGAGVSAMSFSLPHGRLVLK